MPRPKPGLILQPRDKQVLEQVSRYRMLTSEHLRHLVFPRVSVRMANRRLALLCAHHLLKRYYLPVTEGGFVVRSRRPVYCLTRSGAEVVKDDPGSFTPVVPSPGGNTAHNLVATDLLVALQAGGPPAGLEVETLPEPELWLRLAAHRQGGNRFPTAVLPDGAFTIRPPGAASASFCIEVVRAGAKRGNRSIQEKMARYVALNRAGFFREVYGLSHLRAVLLVTTSSERASRLVSLARGLAHGRNLFWATSYERRDGFAMTFDARSVLAMCFLDWRGKPNHIHSQTLTHV